LERDVVDRVVKEAIEATGCHVSLRVSNDTEDKGRADKVEWLPDLRHKGVS
jgi:hypothetical protein